MSWAAGRRLIILLIIGAVVAAFLAILFISTVYKAPSCSDGVQNQGEAGVDCGGPCVNRCAAQEQSPTVLFTKAVPNGTGRTDAVAEVENKNSDAAARNVAYTITFYGAGQSVIGQASGTLDLPPNATVPVFIPGVASGNQQVVNAFLEINTSSLQWVSMPTDTRILPQVATPQLQGTVSAPRVEAVLTDASVTALTNVHAIVFVYDSAGDVIGASSTILPTIPAQGQATALFTWSAAFPAVPTLIEVIPVIPLP
jgi:hypothetical protein